MSAKLESALLPSAGTPDAALLPVDVPDDAGDQGLRLERMLSIDMAGFPFAITAGLVPMSCNGRATPNSPKSATHDPTLQEDRDGCKPATAVSAEYRHNLPGSGPLSTTRSGAAPWRMMQSWPAPGSIRLSKALRHPIGGLDGGLSTTVIVAVMSPTPLPSKMSGDARHETMVAATPPCLPTARPRSGSAGCGCGGQWHRTPRWRSQHWRR